MRSSDFRVSDHSCWPTDDLAHKWYAFVGPDEELTYYERCPEHDELPYNEGPVENFEEWHADDAEHRQEEHEYEEEEWLVNYINGVIEGKEY